MSRRGYLETQGSTKRLRMVMAGYDADDEGTPANAVVFDSAAPGGLPILLNGVYVLTGDKFYSDGELVTWPDVGFAPLGWVTAEKAGVYQDLTVGAVLLTCLFGATGLKFNCTGLSYPVNVYYTVSAVPCS